MKRSRWCWLKVAILVALFAVSLGRELKVTVMEKHSEPVYNHTLAITLVEYASAVYLSDLTELFTWTCPRCNGLTEGFEVLELIVDVQHCLQGYVGVSKDLNAIVIAFRGTQATSIQNWVEDLYWKQLDLNYPGIEDAMVHHGFYAAYHNSSLRPAVISSVEQARELYGDIKILVTGHSMGGAIAAFCGLDLTVNAGAKNVEVMTFGQPRIGNAAFVSYYSQLLPNTFRLTHAHDMVPHLPPYFSHFPQKTYHHLPREVWLHNAGIGSLIYQVEQVCDESGEDPKCSRSVLGNSIVDHLEYFGVQMGCDEERKCRIFMDTRVSDNAIRDDIGNLVLSKNPSSYVLRQQGHRNNSESDLVRSAYS